MIRFIHYHFRFLYDLIVAILFVSFSFPDFLDFFKFLFYHFNASPLHRLIL